MLPMTLLYSSDGSTTTGSVFGMPSELFHAGVFGFSLHQSYGAASNGTWKIEVSNDVTALTDATNAAWDDETSAFSLTDPSAAGAAEELLQFEGKFLAIRATYTKTAGTNAITLRMLL